MERDTSWFSAYPSSDRQKTAAQVTGDKAAVFCYGTATHYLEDESGNLWTVVGSYDFELTSNDGQWTIDVMKFNFKYQYGNTFLPEKAMNSLK